jgi:flagellin
MPLSINNSISSISTRHDINRNFTRVSRQLERLSSGLRVNRAQDDASGLVLSEGMRGELSGLNQNVRNAEQATNMIQVAEGSLLEVNNMLLRMRELAVQSSTSTVNDTNREAIAAELNQLVTEIDRVAQATTYNKQSLLTGFGNNVSVTASTAVTASNVTGVVKVGLVASQTGTFTFVDAASDGELALGNGVVTQTLSMSTILHETAVAEGTSVNANFDRLGIQVTLTGANATGATGAYVDGDLNGRTLVVDEGVGGVFQVGPTESLVNRIEVNFSDMRSSSGKLNLESVSIAAIDSAQMSLAYIDRAITNVSIERGKMGVLLNRLDSTIADTENEIASKQASETSIRDADIAVEVAELSRGRILLQSSNAMLVQANVGSVSILSLL